MIRKFFETRLEVDAYLNEQKIRMEKGYLSGSERKELKQLLEKPEMLIVKKAEVSEYKKIITNINELRKPCSIVEQKEDVRDIIKDLKDTFIHTGGLGISANQIGIQKRISYIKIPKYNPKDKKIEFTELILINAKKIEYDKPIKIQNEGCLSFPGVYVDTLRYVYCVVQYEDENRKPQIKSVQDLESLTIQHETDHQNSLTLFDRKWMAR